MNDPMVFESTIHFRRRGRGARREMRPDAPPPPTSAGRVTRVARLMALAIHFEDLLAAGQVKDYAELARLGHVSRARMTQVMNLRLLAPDIQEALLFLPRVAQGHDPIHLWQLQPIAMEFDWAKQRRMWEELARWSN